MSVLAPPPRIHTLLPGLTCGEYRLVKQIGCGGMGEVWLAHRCNDGEQFAIKFLRADATPTNVQIARFRRETTAASRVRHGNVIAAVDAGEHDGLPYLVMEFARGEDLRSVQSRLGVLSVPNACEVVRQVAEGLRAIEAANLVHRDIKPSNLVLTSDGVVKILDLGLARIDDLDASALTQQDRIMGSFDYIAPERFDCDEADIRTDLYSLGCSLYAFLAGKTPFHSENGRGVAQCMYDHLEREVPPIEQVAPQEIAEGLRSVVHKLLEKEPANRFQTADELLEAIRPFADGHNLPKLIPAAESDTVAIDPAETRDAVVSQEAQRGSARPGPRLPQLLRTRPAHVTILIAAVLLLLLGLQPLFEGDSAANEEAEEQPAKQLADATNAPIGRPYNLLTADNAIRPMISSEGSSWALDDVGPGLEVDGRFVLLALGRIDRADYALRVSFKGMRNAKVGLAVGISNRNDNVSFQAISVRNWIDSKTFNPCDALERTDETVPVNGPVPGEERGVATGRITFPTRTSSRGELEIIVRGNRVVKCRIRCGKLDRTCKVGSVLLADNSRYRSNDRNRGLIGVIVGGKITFTSAEVTPLPQ